MLDFELELPVDEMEDLMDRASALPADVFAEVATNVNNTAQRVLESTVMRYPPARSNEPVRWLHERQRRAVMAKLRLLGMDKDGYERSGRLREGWRASVYVESEQGGGSQDVGGLRGFVGRILGRILGREKQEPTQTDYELSVEISNDAIDEFGNYYARYVQDESWQQPFHEDTGWMTYQEMEGDMTYDLLSELNRSIDQALDDGWGG